MKPLPLRIILLLAFLLPQSGCSMRMSITAQRGAISRGSKAYYRGDYATALNHLRRAEEFYLTDMTEVQKAEVLYLKAASLEAMNHPSEAAALFEHLIKNYPDTRFTVRARGRLEGLRAAPAAGEKKPAG